MTEQQARYRMWDTCWEEDRIAAAAASPAIPSNFSMADMEDAPRKDGAVEAVNDAWDDPNRLPLVLPLLGLLPSEERIQVVRNFWHNHAFHVIGCCWSGEIRASTHVCVEQFVQIASDVHALRFMAVIVLYEMLSYVAAGDSARYTWNNEQMTRRVVRACIIPIAKRLARLQPESGIIGLELFHFESTLTHLVSTSMRRVLTLGGLHRNPIYDHFGAVTESGPLSGVIYPFLAKVWDAELTQLRRAYAESVSLVLESKLPTALAQYIASLVGGQAPGAIPSRAAWRLEREQTRVAHAEIAKRSME